MNVLSEAKWKHSLGPVSNKLELITGGLNQFYASAVSLTLGSVIVHYKYNRTHIHVTYNNKNITNKYTQAKNKIFFCFPLRDLPKKNFMIWK